MSSNSKFSYYRSAVVKYYTLNSIFIIVNGCFCYFKTYMRYKHFNEMNSTRGDTKMTTPHIETNHSIKNPENSLMDNTLKQKQKATQKDKTDKFKKMPNNMFYTEVVPPAFFIEN